VDESEWLACTDPTPMLEFLRGKASDRKVRLFRCASDRKVRLFGCATVRRAWHAIPETGSFRHLVELGELYADGMIGRDELASGRREAELAYTATMTMAHQGRRWTLIRMGMFVILETTRGWPYPLVERVQDLVGQSANDTDAARKAPAGEEVQAARAAWSAALQARNSEREAQSGLLRDLFSNPFRPVSFAPVWRTPTVTALATAAYEDRVLPVGTLDNDRLAVLADALEDAGCDNADILTHLRSPGPHVRGCWPLDLLLARG